ncbi:uncharacterized protein LTR77_007181 [Saxophila tyrrhenica]|uniref:DNA-directed RNA polymerase III RPC4 n=1 Tax=Saxophila tyrrhenica TaxID=1690608 RepID=A0AAV9P6X7_9PEZI|nr:hypothetical protein LTR77_007181 [Saxophila tyrrhenica]
MARTKQKPRQGGGRGRGQGKENPGRLRRKGDRVPAEEEESAQESATEAADDAVGEAADDQGPLEPAVPSSDVDVKPDVEQLNASLANSDLPSDPLAQPQPPAQPTADESQISTAPNDSITVNEPTPVQSPAQLPTPTTSTRKTGPAPRFAGRRSAKQREELLKADEEKRKALRASAAASAQAQGSGAREGFRKGRGEHGRRRGRGRGGYMGQNEREREQEAQEAVPSGPFSAGQIHKDSRHVRRQPPSSGAWGFTPGAAPRSERPSGRRAWSHTAAPVKTSDGKRVKAESGPSTGGRSGVDRDGDTRMNIIDGGYVSSDDDEGEDRMNVEDFGIIDLTQNEGPRDFYAPVRMMRVQHKDRALGINAEGATNQDGAVAVESNDVPANVDVTEKGKGKQKASQDFEVTSEKHVFQAVYSDSEDDVRAKPQIKPDPEATTTQQHDDPPSSPELRRKGKERIKALGRTPSPGPPGTEYVTREEREEHARHQNDLRLLRSELGDPTPTNDANGDATMTDSDRQDKRAEKVYLFQFPPILPDLVPVPIKPDPEAAENGTEDAMHVDPAPPPAANTADKPIKVEDNASPPPKAPLPSGAVGKLHVHASGRVTLDWGGTAMTLNMGTEAGFLQDVLCVSLPEGKMGEDGEALGTGEAVSMGQVKGKFVVVPEWGELV